MPSSGIWLAAALEHGELQSDFWSFQIKVADILERLSFEGLVRAHAQSSSLCGLFLQCIARTNVATGLTVLPPLYSSEVRFVRTRVAYLDLKVHELSA
jgi:hypothetical protein